MHFLSTLFSTESNISAFFCRSSLFRHARFPSDQPACTEALRQLSAKLHVYYGLEVEPSTEALCDSVRQYTDKNPLMVRQVHPYARSRVYDLRRYRNSNLWGPFMDDGSLRVDWERIQCIMTDLCYNLRMYTERRHPVSSLGSRSLASGISSNGASGSSESSASTSPASSAGSFSTSSSTSSSSPLWDQPFQGLAPNSYTSYPVRLPFLASLSFITQSHPSTPPKTRLIPFHPLTLTSPADRQTRRTPAPNPRRPRPLRRNRHLDAHSLFPRLQRPLRIQLRARLDPRSPRPRTHRHPRSVPTHQTAITRYRHFVSGS